MEGGTANVKPREQYAPNYEKIVFYLKKTPMRSLHNVPQKVLLLTFSFGEIW